MSALGNAVLIILVGASQGHVIDIAAGRVVAQMKDDERLSCSLVGGNGAMHEFPCDPVGQFSLALVPHQSMTRRQRGVLINQAGSWQAIGCWGLFEFAFQSVCD